MFFYIALHAVGSGSGLEPDICTCEGVVKTLAMGKRCLGGWQSEPKQHFPRHEALQHQP